MEQLELYIKETQRKDDMLAPQLYTKERQGGKESKTFKREPKN